MRLLHIADLHLGAPLGALPSAEKVRVRRAELLESLRSALELGRAEGVNAVLIAGDLFDSESVSERVRRHVCELISSYSPLPFFYVTGNHERDSFLSREDQPKNLYTFSSPLSCYELGELCIYGTNASAPDMLANIRPKQGKKNILLFHGELGEHCDFGGVIGRSELARSGFDYIALGHYHSFLISPLDGGGIAVYSGVPEGRGFDEVGKKGVVIFDTADFHPHFHPISKRAYHKIELNISDLSSDEEILDRARLALCECEGKDLVRLVLMGEREAELRLDHELLRLYFEERFWYFELLDETRIRNSRSELIYDRSLRGEFVRLVLRDDELSEEEKREIIDCGLLALSGEEMTL